MHQSLNGKKSHPRSSECMNDLVHIARKIIEYLNGTSGMTITEFRSLYSDFDIVLQRTTDAADLREVVDLESDAWLLPFELIKRVYLHAEEIGAIDDDLVKWYASRLLFYGEPSDERKAKELLSRHGLSLPQ
jgi:hypothetical protein